MDLFKNNVMAGVGIAFAATVLAPILIPTIGRVGRPLAKSLVRGGMMLYEKGREVVAVAGESVEDIIAEIRAESAAPDAAAQDETASPIAAAAARETASPMPEADADAERPYGGNGSRRVAQPGNSAGPETVDI